MIDLGVGGEDEDRDLRKLVADDARGVESLRRMRWRHPDVDDGQVGLVGAHMVEELRHVTGAADDVEPRLLEQARHSLAQEDVVVGHDDARPARCGACRHRADYPLASAS